MRTVTLDTCVVLEFWRGQDNAEATAELLRLADQGELDLAVTARIRSDVPRPPLAACIDEIKIIGDPFRLGVSRVGEGILVGPEHGELQATVEAEAKRIGRTPPGWQDVDHLYAHLISRRDVFLTWDRPILAVGDALRAEHGLVVLTPQQFLAQSEAAKSNRGRPPNGTPPRRSTRCATSSSPTR